MTRNEFKAYCLRALGQGIVRVNVTDEQIEDRVGQAIALWQEVHQDAMVEVYHKHQVTAQNITNGYIPIPDSVFSVTEVIPLKSRSQLGGIFNIEYQLHLNDIFDLSFAGGITNYVQVKQYLNFLEDTLYGKERVTFSRSEGRLYIHMDWNRGIAEGQYIFVRGYRVVDPAMFSKVYNDRWLRLYTTELIRKQWGENLSLFGGVALLGGVTLNGVEMRDKADARIGELEEELFNRYSPPPMGFMG